jgi:hypothetical protein
MIERKLKSARMQVPVHDAPEYLEAWGGFVREFARRYDANPLLESIDVTYIGPWGEGDGECSAEQCARFAQLWQKAFPKTPRLAMVGGDQMRAGIATGSGWRCDCFGDDRSTYRSARSKRSMSPICTPQFVLRLPVSRFLCPTRQRPRA